MSTRFVWNKFSVSPSFSHSGTPQSSYKYSNGVLSTYVKYTENTDSLVYSVLSSTPTTVLEIEPPYSSPEVSRLQEPTVPQGSYFILDSRNRTTPMTVLYATRACKIVGELYANSGNVEIDASAAQIAYVQAGKGPDNLGTVSNAASSTYPRHNYTGQITSICAIIPVLLRRCYRG